MSLSLISIFALSFFLSIYLSVSPASIFVSSDERKSGRARPREEKERLRRGGGESSGKEEESWSVVEEDKGEPKKKKKKKQKGISGEDPGGGTRHELRANCPGDCSCSLLCAAVAAVCPARCFLDLKATSGRL